MTSKLNQIGIRAKLFLAFGAIAGTTVVASIAACALFSQVGGLMSGVADRNIPEVIASLELAAQTQSLAASAPALLGAETPQQRDTQVKALKALQDGVAERLKTIAGFQAGQQSANKASGSKVCASTLTPIWPQVLPSKSAMRGASGVSFAQSKRKFNGWVPSGISRTPSPSLSL